MKNVCLLSVTMVLLLLSGIVKADRTVWYVHPDSALNTIQAGLDSCADNDTVLVGPGTYYENIVWPNTQGIYLISDLGYGITIIDGDSNGTVIRFNSSTAVDSTTIVKGFTIRNGFICDSPWVGAGVHCHSASPTIRNNLITSNLSIFGTGGIGCLDCGPKIVGNTISSNMGFGIYYDDCNSAIIDSNLICYNSDVGVRGYICYSICRNTITNNWCGLQGSAFNFADNIISYNVMDGKVFSPDPGIRGINYRSWGGNTYSYNGRWGIGGIEAWATNETITYNGAGGIWGAYGVHLDSCTIAHNYGPGVCVNFEFNSHINQCNIFDNAVYGVFNGDNVLLNAEYNWWGDATGPYHATLNPNGLGDTVSDYVDFDPWLSVPVGVDEQPIVNPVKTHVKFGATILTGSLLLPTGKKCRVFDITGRIVEPDKIAPGIYFVEIDSDVVRKVVKIR